MNKSLMHDGHTFLMTRQSWRRDLRRPRSEPGWRPCGCWLMRSPRGPATRSLHLARSTTFGMTDPAAGSRGRERSRPGASSGATRARSAAGPSRRENATGESVGHRPGRANNSTGFAGGRKSVAARPISAARHARTIRQAPTKYVPAFRPGHSRSFLPSNADSQRDVRRNSGGCKRQHPGAVIRGAAAPALSFRRHPAA